MTTHDDATAAGLLASVLAEPDSDTPRLILADWLEEHGQAERGEFIRVQIELARRGCVEVWCQKVDGSLGPTPPRCPIIESCRELERRERELLTSVNEGAWTGKSLMPLVVDYAADRILWGNADAPKPYEFRRGFVEAITLPADDWLAHHAALLTSHPLHEVRLTTWPGEPFTIYPRHSPGHPQLPPAPGWSFSLDGIELPDQATLFGQRGRMVREMLTERWPAITFTLPDR